MAPSFVGASTAGGNLGTVNLTWPGGLTAGDFAVVTWTHINTATRTTPTGFTQVGILDDSSCRSVVYTKSLAGSESGSLALTCPSGANRQSGTLVVYSGATGLDQIASSAEAGTSTTHVCPNIVTAVASSFIVTMVSERSTTGTSDWTAPSGYTERADTLALATGSGGTITGAADNGLSTVGTGTSVTPPDWTSGSAFAGASVVTWTLSIQVPVSDVRAVTAAGAVALSSLATVSKRSLVSGTGAVVLAPNASGAKVAVATGASTLALTARAGATKVSPVVSRGTALVTARAAAVKRSAVTGRGALLIAPRAAVARVVSVSARGAVVLASSVTITGPQTIGRAVQRTRRAARAGVVSRPAARISGSSRNTAGIRRRT